MAKDILYDLGYLSLGSRLKRMGEHLQADVQRLLDKQNIPIKASQYPLLAAIDRLGTPNVSELVQSLGISQPGITRSVSALTNKGLLEVKRRGDDQRKKTITLSKAGRDLIRKSETDIWPFIEAVLTDICDKQNGTLIENLIAVEKALQRKSLNQRIAAHMKDGGA